MTQFPEGSGCNGSLQPAEAGYRPVIPNTYKAPESRTNFPLGLEKQERADELFASSTTIPNRGSLVSDFVSKRATDQGLHQTLIRPRSQENTYKASGVKKTNFPLGLEKQERADELFASSTTIPNRGSTRF